jgi:hypothetical protein
LGPSITDRLVTSGSNIRSNGILLGCILNALQTRPPGESENDKVHAEILSLIIPRFIAKALQRHCEKGDPYHPGADAIHLISFLERDPCDALLPLEQNNAVVDACAQVQTPAPTTRGSPIKIGTIFNRLLPQALKVIVG